MRDPYYYNYMYHAVVISTTFHSRAQFIEDVREVMGLPEWMLTVDSRKTRTLHSGTCIQFLLHFKGIVCTNLVKNCGI
jgi:hypothetical protein